MYKITYNNKIGNVPMTMQGYLDHYIPELFLEVKQEFENTYNLPISTHLPETLGSSFNKFYLNFSAYLILDQNDNIIDYAFTEFNDLVWILNLIQKNGLSFEVTDTTYTQGIEPILSNFKGLIEVTKL